MQVKSDFTDFRSCTLSLGRLQKMLSIKLPNARQTFEKHKVVIQKMQQTSQEQKIILYNYIYLESA